MPHDPVLVEEVRSWLKRAAEDLRAGGVELAASPPLTCHAVFHAQQAAEKSLKAFLSWKDLPFRKTHSISEIGAACSAVDPSLGAIVQKATPLTEFAWLYRYPGTDEDPAYEEAREALATGAEVMQEIVRRLPAEMRISYPRA